MAVVTVRPDATNKNGAWTISPSGTRHGVTSDNSDGSYVWTTLAAYSPDDPNGRMYLEFPEPAAPLGSRIKAVRLRLRWARDIDGSAWDNADGEWQLVPTGDAEGPRYLESGIPQGITPAEKVFPWRTSRPNGSGWTQASLAAVELRCGFYRLTAPSGEGLQLFEVYLDVDYNERPVATVTGPASPVTDTTRPIVTWDYTDPDGDPQEAFEVEVYSKPAGGWSTAVPGGGGTLVHDSGEVVSGAASYTIPTDLDDGVTYRAYVRARQAWSGSAFWSEWDFAEFTVDIDQPAAPGLAASAEDGQARVAVEVTEQPGDAVPESFEVEYRDDPADSWQALRGGAGYHDFLRGFRLDGTTDVYASTPHVAALGITGDLDVRAHIAPEAWTLDDPRGNIVAKYDDVVDQRSWRLALEADGTLRFSWSADGATLAGTHTSTAAVSVAPRRLWVRATLDVDDGAGGWVLTFYTSDDGVIWTQLGDPVTNSGGGVTSVHAGTSDLLIGAIYSGGSSAGVPYGNELLPAVVLAVEVRDGIGGTVVANPDFTDAIEWPDDTAAATDGAGLAWTLHGVDGVQTGILYDHEAPFGVQREYQARALITVTGNVVASPPAAATATLATTGRWLTDVRDPTLLNAAVRVREHTRTWAGRDVVHRPAGMDVAVVESEATTRQDDVSIWSLDSAQHEIVVAALRSTRTLLYRDRRDRVYFRFVGDRASAQVGPDGSLVDAHSGSMVEVARPPV